jgi:dTDP-4-amino-4,6-dideoxygalactose transaminase
MKIPFMDLHRQYLSVKPEIDAAIQSVINSTEFIGGKEKTKFEENFAKACGTKHCVGVGNGTDAIYLSLKALGIGTGDEVIVPVNTFIATSEAVTIAGARPVFVDCDPRTYLLDLTKVSNLLEKRAHNRGGKIKAIIPVHLYGRINPMNEIMELAKTYDLKVMEDSAQAHLAEWDGQPAGSHGHMATFSFYPGKNLGAFGDAGAIVTNDPALAELSKKLANHGRVQKYDHDIEGYNSRLDGLQAAILNVKLPHLQKWSEQRRKIAKTYNEKLSFLEDRLHLPEIPADKQHVFHLYVVRIKNREMVQKKLEANGIQSGVHYPISLHNLKAYAHFNHRPEDFPVANAYQSEIMSLPLFPEMTDVEQNYVVSQLAEALN